MRPRSSTSDGLLDPLFGFPVVDDKIDDRALLQAMLDVERALVVAAAACGIVPTGVSDAVAQYCLVDLYDAGELGVAAQSAGNPVVPLVSALGSRVDESAKPWVHFGATSQDILDSALMLLVVRATPAILAELCAAADACAALARRHRDSVMVARTLGQQAQPTTFGLKAAGWLTGLDNAVSLVRETVRARAAVQLGGAVGTLAAYGGKGLDVVAALAAELGLAEPSMPWHTDRQRILDIAHALAAAVAAAAKVALDVILLAQSEVGEAHEGGDQHGTSSAMPHKQNPVDAILVTAAHKRVIGLLTTLQASAVHEHERATGSWHAEWEPLRELVSLTGGASHRIARVLSGLQIDDDRMRANVDAAGGSLLSESVAMRLAPAVGRSAAQAAVRRAIERSSRERLPLREALLTDQDVAGNLSPEEVDEALQPQSWLGSAGALVDRALQQHARMPT